MIVEQQLSFSREISRQFIKQGWAIDPGVPGYSMAETVRRFQMANSIEVDGIYGPQTADYLFGHSKPAGTLIERMLAVASSQVGVSEVPPGSNRGPQIDLVLSSVGLQPGYAWCAAFVYWCFQQASKQTYKSNPCPKSAGVLNLWNLAGYKESGLKRITSLEADDDHSLIKPGMQFLLKLSSTAGHTGIIESVNKFGQLITIEGNSNQQGSREGTAVLRQTKRRIDSINLGFISYE